MGLTSLSPVSTIILGNHECKIIISLEQLKQRGLVTADEKIRKIDKYKFMIDLQCGLSLTWVEGCWKFLNIQENDNLAFFSNILNRTQKTLDEDDAIHSVAIRGIISKKKNKRVYPGNKNPLYIERFYKTSFIFAFDIALLWYSSL